MIAINEEYNESAIEEFIDQLKDIYYDYFPNSRCEVSTSFRSMLKVTCYLAKDDSETYGGLDVIKCNGLGDRIRIANTTYGNDGRPLDLDETLVLDASMSVLINNNRPNHTQSWLYDLLLPSTQVIGTKEDILDGWSKICRKIHKKLSRLNSEGLLWDDAISKYDINDKL